MVKNFAPANNEEAYISFINKIGKPIQEKRNFNSKEVFDVKVSKKNSFFNSYANSNLDFSCHTDCSDFIEIPNCISLFCLKPAQKGGETIFCNLQTIIEALPDNLLQFLLNHTFQFRHIKKTILQKTTYGYKISYNRFVIESYSEKLTEIEHQNLNEFDAILKTKATILKLEKNDVFLCRNDVFLHGRLFFDKNSTRLLKRIRFEI
ncbi:MAG: TauD/TfdA family dioxygenase [Flavobacterium sp.]|uniref:TauD/TfdA family dioxygenase n=1 Tax=Flavobacterium sp. TaxID=239 RepID=UPI00261A4781|nr:TauD/TfdA family dioxygenase [Flavobacterium sp.]MDD5149315.1 TauD/TfdA family dioxygenase [Flavobacterium sp.]